ncbi:hypothetical protein [Streptomyces sp. NPDC091212]|uniref:hypothetical protein n=1 Tax=Streptomyces sp. NPDC091212 TaxID=3155191 RepID=UPI00342F5E4F
MEAVRVLILVLLCGGGWAAWRRARFPGEWTHTFSARYARERTDLAGARRALRDLEKDARNAQAAARAQIGLERSKYEQRVEELERKVARLQDPGLGAQLTRLGELALYEHAVVHTVDGRSKVLPLDGLHARFDPGERVHSLYLTQPDGRVCRAKYPHRPAPAADQEASLQLFDEEQVRDFEVRIHDAAADENAFRSTLAAQLTQAQEESAEARQDTGQLDSARQRLTEVIDRNRNDPRRKEALTELEEAHDRWETLTQRRPPR